MPIPMLTEDEWLVVEPILNQDNQRIKDYREQNHVGLREAIDALHSVACDKYFEITGFRETNHAAIWHHRLSLYGSECLNCGHLLRTPKSSFCANCGAKSSPVTEDGEQAMGGNRR
jgi:hypothetical protein